MRCRLSALLLRPRSKPSGLAHTCVEMRLTAGFCARGAVGSEASARSAARLSTPGNLERDGLVQTWSILNPKSTQTQRSLGTNKRQH